MRRLCLPLLTALLLLSACAGGGGESSGQAGSASSASATLTSRSTPATTTTSQDRDNGSPTGPDVALVPVTLERTGGIAGLRQQVEVRADGTYRIAGDAGTADGRLSSVQERDLARALEQAHLATATPVAPTEQRSDGFAYVVRSQGHTFTATDTTLPQPVRPLVDALVALLTASATS